MSCGRGPDGSGYVKSSDPALAAANEKAFADILAARAQYDSYWLTTPLTSCNPNGSNAQPGWPHAEFDKKWEHAELEAVDPADFVGIDDDIKTITIDRSLDISGYELTPIYDSATEFLPLQDADDFIQHEYWPVDPNPPSPLTVAEAGSSSTTTISNQADKSPVAN
jgi:hypothetical protein